MFFIKLLLRAGFWPPVVDRTLKSFLRNATVAARPLFLQSHVTPNGLSGGSSDSGFQATGNPSLNLMLAFGAEYFEYQRPRREGPSRANRCKARQAGDLCGD